jgi:hypothetical protein
LAFRLWLELEVRLPGLSDGNFVRLRLMGSHQARAQKRLVCRAAILAMLVVRSQRMKDWSRLAISFRRSRTS